MSQKGKGVFVGHQGEVLVELENGSGHMGGNGAEESGLDSLVRIIRVKNYEELSRTAANIISAQVILKPDCAWRTPHRAR